MKTYFAILVLGAIVGVAVTGDISDIEDTIIITNAETSTLTRVKRDIIEDNFDRFGYDSIVVSPRCTTTRGKQGSCRTIGECYPFLFPLNSTRKHSTINNELTKILIEVSGICDMPSTVKAQENFKRVLEAEFLLCCPDPISNIGRPLPPPAFPERLQGVGVESFKGQQRSCSNKADQIPSPILLSEPPIKSNETEGNRIVGGKEAKIGEFPWIVALFNRGSQFCGGSIISNEWVLTAAHCIQHMAGTDVANLRLNFGDHDIYDANDVPIQTRTASMVLYNRNFNMNNLQNDIGMIKLSTPLQFTKTIQPVCIHNGHSSVDGLLADIPGWGQLCEGCQQPRKLRTAKVKIWSHEDCRQKYANIIQILPSMVCSGGEGMDSCRGDSGGPMTINSKQNPEQVGLVSFGVDCGTEHPGVYTRVSSHMNWINRNFERFKKPQSTINLHNL